MTAEQRLRAWFVARRNAPATLEEAVAGAGVGKVAAMNELFKERGGWYVRVTGYGPGTLYRLRRYVVAEGEGG